MASLQLKLLPEIFLDVDTDKLWVEQHHSLEGFHIGEHVKIHVDIRVVNTLTQEQFEAKSIVILRPK